MADIQKPTPAQETTNAMLAGLGQRLEAQKVYSLGLEQIISGPPPGDDLFVGWRYLEAIAPDLAIAILVNQEPGEAPVFAGVSGGPQLAKAVRAIRALGTLPSIPAGLYESRLLRIIGLLTDALWLKPPAGGAELVVPFDTVESRLQEMYVYAMDDFLNIVRPLAKEYLEAWSKANELRSIGQTFEPAR
jgi:hypothetical protein